MDEKITHIQYGFHGADLFAGYENEEEYDVPASAARYAALVEEKLLEAYPGAEIEVPYDLDAGGVLPYRLQAAVNYDTNDNEVAIVEHLAAQVYEEYAWLITTPSERARPIREVEEATGVAARTIRRWAATGQIWAEQRYGKLWYVDPDDVQRMAAETGEGTRRGWPLGKARPCSSACPSPARCAGGSGEAAR